MNTEENNVFTIRDALEEDYPQLFRLMTTELGYTHLEEELFYENLRTIQKNQIHRILVAEHQEKIAGFTAFFPAYEYESYGPYVRIQVLAVKQSLQHHGIGRLLLNGIIERTKNMGISQYELTSNLGRNATHDFYEKFGFEKFGYGFRLTLPKEE